MWVRWHITLSRFLRDYIYIPLGGSRVSDIRAGMNSILTMTTAGIWHGANWNYLLWGFVIGLSLVIERNFLYKFKWWREKSIGASAYIKIVMIFFFWILLATIFRIQSLNDLWIMTERIFTFQGGKSIKFEECVTLTILFLILHYIELKPLIIEKIRLRPIWTFSIAGTILLFVLADLSNKQTQFIYFQF
jgi:D-alanyl-lipoteichoic acid acyltransferase DltB (MBOAT superfamily)